MELDDLVTESLPAWTETEHLNRLLWISLRFPTPFSKLAQKSRGTAPSFEEREPAFRILSAPPVLSKFDKEQRERDGEIYITAKVLIRRGVTMVTQDARAVFKKFYAAWMKLVGSERAKVFKKAPGGGAKEHWSWLRDLAAYRLQNAGYGYMEASLAIHEATGVKIVDKHKFLPYYKAHGRWTEAVRRAADRIAAWPDFE